MSTNEKDPVAFSDFNLLPQLLEALNIAGYEVPTPIQEKTIPSVMSGVDVIGQAQTGTGKTAAFALPILSRIDLGRPVPQALILTPTRELAIQVSEAFHRYASRLRDFRVLPIYGGQDYSGQLKRLKRGVHVVVGTPGRVMDHMRRGSLNLDAVSTLVLDEADEMLRMGFIDDVEWVLDQTPAGRQIALFSATMPAPIRKIAGKYMRNPEQITIKASTMTVATTRQRFRVVGEHHKLDALTRILEVEPFEGVLIFVRTKTATLELSEKLEARGYPCAALNGDIAQNRREQIIAQLKDGRVDIVVATDVAARGLDVDRISHVINYDVPYDTEAYIHRIGRTGRAGRSGEALLFVTPRERRMLAAIEKATRQKIDELELPTSEKINDTRISRFKQQITDTLARNDLDFFVDMMDGYRQEHDVPAINIAAALARIVQGDSPMLMPPEVKSKPDAVRSARDRKPAFPEKSFQKDRPAAPAAKRQGRAGDAGLQQYRIEVGLQHGVKPGNIVGAIANEAGLDAADIGKISIENEFSTVDLPGGMPSEIFQHLKTVWVSGQQLNISKTGESAETAGARAKARVESGWKPRGAGGSDKPRAASERANPRAEGGWKSRGAGGSAKPRAAKDGWSKPSAAKDGWSKPKAAKDGWSKPRAAKDGWEKPSAAKEGWAKPKAATEGWAKPKAAKDGWSKPKAATDGQAKLHRTDRTDRKGKKSRDARRQRRQGN